MRDSYDIDLECQALWMARVEPLRRSPIGFAHRGARAHASENTLEAFTLGLRLGATGLESDVWLTADGIPVLDHDGVVGRLRRTPIGTVGRAALPEHIPSLDEFYETVGVDTPLSLDVKDPAAFDTTLAVAEEWGAASNLWLCHHDWQVVAGWRKRSDAIHLVDSTRMARITEGPERRAMTLHNAGIEVLNMHHTDWSAGLTTLFHRFGIECFGWDAQQPRILDRLLGIGIDGVYSDHVDRMVDAMSHVR